MGKSNYLNWQFQFHLAPLNIHILNNTVERRLSALIETEGVRIIK
jgi:hypothetical protein